MNNTTIIGSTIQEIINTFTNTPAQAASWRMGPMKGKLIRSGNTCEMKNSRGVTIYKWEA